VDGVDVPVDIKLEREIVIVSGKLNVENSTLKLDGTQKTTLKCKLGPLELEISDDGKRKVKLKPVPGVEVGAVAEFIPSTGEFGSGVEFELGKKAKNGKVTLSLGFQGLGEDTLFPYFCHAPGFFERSAPPDILKPGILFSNVFDDNRQRLISLGWDNESWADKSNLNLEEFPESARTKFEDLNDRQRCAAFGLGFTASTWLESWEGIARKK
jgi:hypothetical protein